MPFVPADGRKANGKFRTLVHSYLGIPFVTSCIRYALKQSPSRRRIRKSVGDEDVPVSTRDVNPIMPNTGVTRIPLRSSYRYNTGTDSYRVPAVSTLLSCWDQIPFIDDQNIHNGSAGSRIVLD
uniref:Uncharacterized protein n=1 Tax=Heterorhabditis bacteriophora TaxID=37862 RepID=A0A1I7WS25_HETBA